MKALISSHLEPRGLRYGGSFIFCHALLNKVILLRKEGLGKTGVVTAVRSKKGKQNLTSYFTYNNIFRDL